MKSWMTLVLTAAALVLVPIHSAADQACNSEASGTLSAGSQGVGVGSSQALAAREAFVDLTGYSAACAVCDEPTQERCFQEYDLDLGGGTLVYFPVFTIGAPLWGCVTTVGASGGSWSSTCGDC